MVSNELELDSKSKYNIIIFLVISIFAIHHLIFLISFEINFPYSVDFSDEFTPVFNLLINNEFTLLITKGVHILFFPNLISLPILYFSNFDVTILYYLQWVVTAISLWIFYLILKQTDKKLIWTLIPISAFLFNPLISSAYWAISNLPWLFAMLGIILVVYIFNKKNINLKNFSSGTFFGLFSSLSIVVGVVVWIAGLILILKNYKQSKNHEKKWICLWLSSIILTGALFFILTSGSRDPIHFELLLSPAGYTFITNFLVSSFRLKFQFLMISIGSISLILSLIFTYFLIKKDYFKNYLPWFIFLLVGILAAIITASGRVQFLETHLGNEPYYIPISHLFQIGLLVLSAKLFFEYKKYNDKKKILSIIFILIIIFQMILLVPSYYSGWQRGEYYYDEKTRYVSCFSLNPAQSCQELHPILYENYFLLENEFLEMINHLIINKQSIFNDHDFNKENDSNIVNFSKFQNHVAIFSENNKINSINKISISDQTIYEIVDPLLFINGGLIIDQDSTIEGLFMLIDDKPILKINDYNTQTIKQNDNSSLISWSIYLMSGYIENGCHSVNIVGITETEKIYSSNDISICR